MTRDRSFDRAFTAIGGILIAVGLVTALVLFVRGEFLRGILAIVLSGGIGALQILWSGSPERDPKTGRGRSTLRDWIADYVLIAILGTALVGEILEYGTSEPWVIAVISVLLVPLLTLHYVNFVSLVMHPRLWRFLLRILAIFRLSLPLIAGGSVGLVIGASRPLPSVSVFATAAPLVPLLVLVLAVEGRTYLLGVGESPGRLFLVLWTFAGIAAAEFVCLTDLAHQEVRRYDLAIVGGVLTTLFTSALLLALLGPFTPTQKDAESPPKTSTANGE